MARKGRLARVWLAMLVVCSLVAAPLTAMAAGEVAENVNTIGITKDTTQEQLDAWAEGAAVISGTTGQSRTITLQKDIVPRGEKPRGIFLLGDNRALQQKNG